MEEVAFTQLKSVVKFQKANSLKTMSADKINHVTYAEFAGIVTNVMQAKVAYFCFIRSQRTQARQESQPKKN